MMTRTIFWLICLNVVRVGRFAHKSQQFDCGGLFAVTGNSAAK